MEYTEEEKKAIEFFEKIQKYMGDYRGPLEENTDIVLNIIEKQQKEIERLEKTIDENIVIEPDETGGHEELDIHIKDYIPKEVIRNKIKELENQKISTKVGFEKIFETKMDNAKIIDTLRELLRSE